LNKTHLDEHAILFKIIKKSDNAFVTPADFHILIDGLLLNSFSWYFVRSLTFLYINIEVVKRHPGLEFLASLPIFQSCYSKYSNVMQDMPYPNIKRNFQY
jgi:hypothetical protein